MHKLGALAFAASLGIACADDANPVVGIDYTVSEFPSSGKFAWSCMVEGHTDGAGAAAIDWSVGAPVVATPSPRYERVCGGLMGSPCPDPKIVSSALDARAWTVAMGPTPNTILGGTSRYLEAVGPGLGGLKVDADGRSFPSLELRATAPTGFRFLRVSDANGASLEPIDRLALAKGAQAIVVPRLVSGTKTLCGFATMTMTSSGPLVERHSGWNPEGRANAPILVTGAASGSIEVSAGGVTGTLMVDTNG